MCSPDADFQRQPMKDGRITFLDAGIDQLENGLAHRARHSMSPFTASRFRLDAVTLPSVMPARRPPPPESCSPGTIALRFVARRYLNPLRPSAIAEIAATARRPWRRHPPLMRRIRCLIGEQLRLPPDVDCRPMRSALHAQYIGHTRTEAPCRRGAGVSDTQRRFVIRRSLLWALCSLVKRRANAPFRAVRRERIPQRRQHADSAAHRNQRHRTGRASVADV